MINPSAFVNNVFIYEKLKILFSTRIKANLKNKYTYKTILKTCLFQ